ncbi:hypothetical protein JZU57_02005, partial [bacterium]|nr:hypothetical protein [bacterium]
MSAQTAFSMGNYSLAAASGEADDWRTWAAWGLLGRTERALSGLAGFQNPEARFYEAVAIWIGGDDERAAAALADLPGAHASNLRDLLARPHINVLAMLPGNRHGPHVHLLGAAADSRFHLSNISVHPDDLPVRPYAAINDYVASAG